MQAQALQPGLRTVEPIEHARKPVLHLQQQSAAATDLLSVVVSVHDSCRRPAATLIEDGSGSLRQRVTGASGGLAVRRFTLRPPPISLRLTLSRRQRAATADLKRCVTNCVTTQALATGRFGIRQDRSGARFTLRDPFNPPPQVSLLSSDEIHRSDVRTLVAGGSPNESACPGA